MGGSRTVGCATSVGGFPCNHRMGKKLGTWSRPWASRAGHPRERSARRCRSPTRMTYSAGFRTRRRARGRSRQPVHQDFQTQGDEMEKDCGAVAREMAALLHERLLRARDGIVGARRPEGTDCASSLLGDPATGFASGVGADPGDLRAVCSRGEGSRPDLRGLRPRPGSRDVRGGPRRPHGGRSADPLRRVLRRLTSDIAMARRRVGTGARGPGSRRRFVSNADRTARPGAHRASAAVNPPANRILAGGGTAFLAIIGPHRRGESCTLLPRHFHAGRRPGWNGRSGVLVARHS